MLCVKYEGMKKRIEVEKRKKNSKTVGACLIAVLLVLMSITPVAMAIPGKLWLDTIPEGTYVGPYEDAWLTESNVTADTSFDLTIYYHHGADIRHLYLLVAVDKDPAGNVTVTVNNTEVGPYDGFITTNNNALVNETDPDYEFPGHGIYNYGSDVHFNVTNITIPDGGVLSAGETIIVPIEIDLIGNEYVKVHFDVVGGGINNEAVAFNPPSHDVTYNVPEFSTIAIPVVAILGLFFFFSHRKHRKESK